MKQSNHVLMVSKPITPPWSDSNKNLVRDIVLNADHYVFHLLSVPGFSLAGRDNVLCEPVYRHGGSFSPSLAQNLRVMTRLMCPDGAIPLYHFFFTPHFRTSSVVKTIMAVKKKKSVHTLSSYPGDDTRIGRLLFSDCIVALSDYSCGRLKAQDIRNVVRIYPGVEIEKPVDSEVCRQKVSQTLGIQGDFLVLYSGDYEFSRAHEVIGDALPEMVRQIPGVKVLFACRHKTPESAAIEKEVKSRIEQMGFAEQVRFTGEVACMRELTGASDVIIFPAQSHAHKMDIPLFLLEALEKGKPVIVSAMKPFSEIMKDEAGFLVPPGDSGALAGAVVSLHRDRELRLLMGEKGRKMVEAHFNSRNMAAAYEECYGELLGRAFGTKKYYDVYSNVYDAHRENTYHRLIDALECELIEAHMTAGMSVLEAGCGTGRIMDRLKRVEGLHTGIDLSYGMLESAAGKGHRVVQSNLAALPFRESSFDMVYSFKVLPHVKEISEAVSELVRVAKPGGTIFLEFYNSHSLRGFRWALKKGLLAGKISELVRETDVFTRYDSPGKVRSYLPQGITVLRQTGIMIVTPFAAILEVPVLSAILCAIEKKCSHLLGCLGGFTIMVLEKKKNP